MTMLRLPRPETQFHGDLEVDAAAALSYVENVRRTTGVHLTLTHLVVRAVVEGLKAVPSLNVRLVHGREHPRTSIDVFVIVAVGRDELTGVKVVDADRKTAVDIAREIEATTSSIRGGEDPRLGDAEGLEMFGSAMVGAIGASGFSRAYSSLAPYYRVPVLVLLGAVTEKPVVVSGRVVARPVLPMTATFDHRYADGLAVADFGHAAAAYLRDPAGWDARLERSNTECLPSPS